MIARAAEDLFPYPELFPDPESHQQMGELMVRWYFRGSSRLPVHIHRYDIPPGKAEERHTHDPDEEWDELYIVLAGSATVTVDGHHAALGQGDAVLAPAGAEHEVANAGDSTLCVLNIWGCPGAHLQPAI